MITKIKNKLIMKNISLKILMPVLVSIIWVSLFFHSGSIQAQERTDFCADWVVTAVQGSNSIGCFIDVTFNQTWTSNIYTVSHTLPHGVQFTTNSPTTILNVTNISGAWFSGATINSYVGGNILYWNKPVIPGNAIPGNAIPSGQTLSFRVYINSNSASSISVIISQLNGNSWPTNLTATALNCVTPPYIFEKPYETFTISGGNICAGSATILNLAQIVPPGSVKWYKAPFPCPSSTILPPAAPWVLVQTGGLSYPTGILNASACYVAVVTEGCFSYVTNVSTVLVCQPLSTIGGITASSGLTNINGLWRACMTWTGTLTLPSTGITCPTTVTWKKYLNGVQQGPDYTCSNVQPCLTMPTGTLTAPALPNCANRYTFTSTITNECGTTTRSFDIYIDRTTSPGQITAHPSLLGTGNTLAPILCYDGYTVLNYAGGCGKIVRWEWSEVITPGTTGPWTAWQTLSGAGTSLTYWTNGLKKTTRYRVLVQNGACPQVFSNPIVVTVKPKLTVSLATNNNSICPSPVPVITATLPAGYPTAGLTYQWYKDGILITTTTTPSLNVTSYGAGNYSVIVIDAQCGSAQSNVVTICGRPIVAISGPCGICNPGSVLLQAIVEGGCSPCTYVWKKGNTVISTGVTATVTTPGTYTLIVTCGNCVVTVTHTIQLCPKQ